MFFDKRYTKKPDKSDIGYIVNSLTECTIDIKELADGLVHGCTFIPALLKDGKKDENFFSQELWVLDFDHNSTIDDILNRCKSKGLPPVFGYTSFNHSPQEHRFRLVFHTNKLITDKEQRDKIQCALMSVFPECDPSCKNAARLYFGGKQQIMYDENAVIDTDELLAKYSHTQNSTHDNQQKYSNKQRNTKKETFSKGSSDRHSKIQAISNLDVTAMRKLLGFVDDNNDGDSKSSDFRLVGHTEGVLPPSNKKSSFLLLSEKPPNMDFPLENTVVKCKGDLLELFKKIDLNEYIGVENKKFCCCIPKHSDTRPSANIFESKNGQPLYKCHSCGFTGNIITLTEALSGCKRHEAINFIKEVYGIKLEESDWTKQQKELLIESANYLSSEEFKDTFPVMAQLIRHRKHYLQRILLHFSQFVNEESQINGYPIFYSSYNTLLNVCDIPTSTPKKLSETLTLFSLLDLIEKLPEDKIPQEELNKAKSIAATYGFKKITSFYRVEEYGLNTLSKGEEKAKILKSKNLRISGCTREMVLRTFGKEEADRIYPQYTYNNEQGTSEKSDQHTLAITKAIQYCIENKGYATEKDVIRLLSKDYNCESTEHQLTISLQEILDTYSLKRVRLNKQLKESLNIDMKGYPYVIIEKDENEV